RHHALAGNGIDGLRTWYPRIAVYETCPLQSEADLTGEPDCRLFAIVDCPTRIQPREQTVDQARFDLELRPRARIVPGLASVEHGERSNQTRNAELAGGNQQEGKFPTQEILPDHDETGPFPGQ